MIAVPEAFARSTVAREGAAGQAWIDALPGLVSALCTRWGLVVDGAPMHGYVGLVVPVRRAAEPLALKVSWMDASSEHEARALDTWDGRGAVRMVASDRAAGALLLERLDASRTLMDLPPHRAATIAGGLLRRLAVPAPADLPTVVDEVARLRQELPALWTRTGRPFPRRVLDRALDADRAGGPDAPSLLVNQDLHYENVLAARREPWLVIDPKVLVGDVEWGVAPLVWNRFEELGDAAGLARRVGLVVEAAGLDAPWARRRTLLRVLDYWLWALDLGLPDDPPRCAALVDWLERAAPPTR